MEPIYKVGDAFIVRAKGNIPVLGFITAIHDFQSKTTYSMWWVDWQHDGDQYTLESLSKFKQL